MIAELVVDRLPRPGPQRRGPRAAGRAARRSGGGRRPRRCWRRYCHLAHARRGTGTAAATGRRARGRTPRPARSRRPARRRRGSGRSGGLLGARAQVGAGRRRQPRVELGEAAPGPHRGERGGQAALGRRGVVDVGRGDAADVVAGGELGEGVVARRVERVAVVPQLDEHAVAPERLDQPLQLAPGRGRTVGDSAGGHGPLAAPGEHPHVPGRVAGDVGERELRRALLPRQVPEAQRPGQPGVAGGPVGEQQQVLAVRVGGVAVGHPAGGDLRRASSSSRERHLAGRRRGPASA